MEVVTEHTPVDRPKPLSSRDRAVLEFESSWWLLDEPKDGAIRRELGISPTRYYQALRRLVDDERALEAAPLTVRRLRRAREQRRAEIVRRLDGIDSAG